jgi:pyruvate dehydrogenase E2 component (dihydrolipoamide acetyltransferase)
VSLEAVASAGVRGTIKEADVRRFVTARRVGEPRTEGLPAAHLERFLEPARTLTRHELAVIDTLRGSVDRLLLATVEADVELPAGRRRIDEAQSRGVMVTLLHLVIATVGRVLRRHAALIEVRDGQNVFRYRDCDIAFVMRAPDGRLFTPVVRGADTLDLDATARTCHAAAVRVARGTIRPEALEGACFTVSNITEPALTRFTALPNRFQAAILAVAGERLEARPTSHGIASVPLVTMTLTYDHALCDGVYAAAFLADLKRELET